MTDTVISTTTADEELIDVLTAISVVSMRLARNLTRLSLKNQKGETHRSTRRKAAHAGGSQGDSRGEGARRLHQ